MGLDPRQSTPGFKRQIVLLSAETRSFQRSSLVLKRVVGLEVSTNTIQRIVQEVGNDLEAAEQAQWERVLTGEITPPELAIVATDGGRIRTRKIGCGPGVHLNSKGWNETKNAIFVSATSQTSTVDPDPDPPACFVDPEHVAKLTEQAKTTEKRGPDADSPTDSPEPEEGSRTQDHKPQRILRTVLSSMKNSKAFGQQMAREAARRRFEEAGRKAFVADGLACNWTIQRTHFRNYVPILDFTHAVTYLFTASLACFGKGEAAWSAYLRWMQLVWIGKVGEVLAELERQQTRLGLPEEDTLEDDPREQLRKVIGYFENNRKQMKYDAYRRAGLPTTSAWMESAVKEINYRCKGTEMFWNHPTGAEAILQIRAASLSDDDRLVRFLTKRPGVATVRPQSRQTDLQQAA